MDNIVKSFFSEAMKNAALQSQLDPIWSRLEDAEKVSEAKEPLQQVISLAAMHGFKFTADDLDEVINASLTDDFVKIQAGEIELTDADLDLVAAGYSGKACDYMKANKPKAWKKYCT